MSSTPSSAEMAARRRPAGVDSAWRRLGRYQAINIVVIYAVLLVVCTAWSLIRPDQLSFATQGNLAVLAQQIPVTAIVAIGVGLLMISGEFDISVAGTFTLVPFVAAIMLASYGLPVLVAVLLSLAVAVIVGIANGILTTRFNIPSFIATLGTMFVLRGVVRWVSLNPKTNQPDSDRFFPGETFEALLTGHIAGPFYAQLVWLLLVSLGAYALLNRHRYGNHLFACGGNRSAAIAVGVPVPRVKMIAFVICAVTAGFAGILQATRINEIEPSYATISGLELKAIAAVVVGGVSLLGGRGAILGMVLGAALIETVDNLLVLVSAPETVFKGFLGATIILAAILNAVIRRRSRS